MKTAAATAADFDRPALNSEGFAVKKSIGGFPVGRVEDATEGRTRNGHPFGRLLLIQSFKISQSQGFELVQGHDDFFQIRERNSGRLKDRGGRPAGDATGTEGSGHGALSGLLWTYVHYVSRPGFG
jgi:hypothetical protein